MEFQTSSQPQKESILKIILEVIGGLLILFIFLTISYFGKKEAPPPIFQKEEASKKENQQQIILPKVLYNLAGPIQELQKDSLTFEASIPEINGAGQLAPKTELRKVLITTTTKFSRLAFVAQEGTNQKTPQETAISFKDFKVKDYIEVISNQDISQAQEFTAVQIRILPQ